MKSYNFIKSMQPRERKTQMDLLIHTQRRAKQRYNLDLTEEDVRRLVKYIRNRDINNSRFICHQTNTRMLLEVKVNDIWIPVIYNKTFKMIATVFPSNWRDTAYDHGWRFE